MMNIRNILLQHIHGYDISARRLLAIWLSTALLLCGTIIVFSEIGSSSPSAFASGSGTPEKPFIISNVWELQNMSADLNAHYALGNDIDAAITSGWNAGAGFEPIGIGPWDVPANRFRGSLDGRSHTISGLYINRPDSECVGLFGHFSGWAYVTNLSLVNAEITGNQYVGGIVGYVWGGFVLDSHVTGVVSGNDYIGGLVGMSRSVSAMINSYAAATINGNDYVGGLLGYNMRFSNVTDCYSAGTVTGNDYVGGLVGYNNGTVSNSYSIGTVTGNNYVGGLVGRNNDGIVSNSFWDTLTSGMATSDGGTGKTTAEMKTLSTFAKWDFENIWWMEEGETYPLLRFQKDTDVINKTGIHNQAIILMAAAISAALLAVLLLRRRSKPSAAEPPQAAEPRPEEPHAGEEEPRDS